VVGTSDRRTRKELAPIIRPLAALASVILMVFGLMTLIPDCASACSCAIVGSQKERVKSELSHSDAVFSGEVVKIDRPSPIKSTAAPETVSFRVSEVWKGPEGGMLEVRTPVSGTSCGYHFEEGQEYLVYAGKGMSVNLCSETKPLSKAGADLALLGEGEKPTDGGDSLNDTSGIVSGGAMAGMAGIAMVASFLLVVRLVRSG
jgi:hypothetical protein